MRRVPLAELARDRRGSMAIETAIVAPVLALMAVGAFQVSAMVARQSELQSAAAEAEAIALAAVPETQAQVDTIRNVIKASAGLTDDQVTITRVYRCTNNTVYVTSAASCASGAEVSSFLRIAMTDKYVPQWTRLGIGRPITYRVTRTVQVS